MKIMSLEAIVVLRNGVLTVIFYYQFMSAVYNLPPNLLNKKDLSLDSQHCYLYVDIC